MTSARLALALDVDGTLVPPGGALARKDAAALERAGAHGVLICFVTGKSWLGLSPLAVGLGLGGPHICVGGTQLIGIDGDRVDVGRDVAAAGVAQGRAIGIPFCVYYDDGWMYASRDAVPDLVAVGEPRAFITDEPIDARPLKVLWCIREGDTETERTIMSSLEGFGGRFVRTSPLFFELMPAGVDKGTALLRLLDHVGIEAAHCVAVGDAANDIPMFGVAGTAVAMPLAAQEAKDAADFVIPDLEGGAGVAWVVDSLVLSDAGRND